MLAVGATYSLAKAHELLPGNPTDLRGDSVAIVNAIADGRSPDLGTFPTWALGFYLNSTEARIQAALHRLLRAYTAKNGYASTLVAAIEKLPPGARPPKRAMEILRRSQQGFAEDNTPGAALARIWARSNSVKHDPAQNISDQFSFRPRWDDCRAAVADLLVLIDVLGTHRGAIAAAYLALEAVGPLAPLHVGMPCGSHLS